MNMFGTTIKHEKAKHREAFEMYYALGDKRNYKKIAEAYHVSDRSVQNWSTSFNWPERVKERDNMVNEQISKTALDDAVSRKLANLAILTKMKDKFYKELSTGRVKIDTVKALETIMKLELAMLDAAKAPEEIVTVRIVDAEPNNVVPPSNDAPAAEDIPPEGSP